ncbi:peroxidase [Favolaschia claudopus]|uniref:Peroxidase n=1 Tax=Favolaschia claudopus TaxID=2862362 RepID=A0AAW0AGK5_9AGAR
MFPLTLFLTSTCFATVHGYLWPSPMLDELESLLYEITAQPPDMASFISPCDSFISGGIQTGRSNPADWIRTAYHDMATHNIADGTGGLDASIRFAEEQARPENAGNGFSNTLGVVAGFSSRYVSIADTIALGTVMAVEFCGGPRIPFRGGRIDATEPNLPGVPEPDQTLDSHIASFARQGFTQQEMITLVACGHTFGGVQHEPFPNIVHEINDSNNTQSVAHFDTTNIHFDNNRYGNISPARTQNPLVVGFNDTTNSDKRIFSSDGNVTMRSLHYAAKFSFANSPDLFASSCSSLLARMLDTVPRGVVLSDVITPLPVKPGNIQFSLDGDVLQFTGNVRFFNLPSNTNRIALLLWDDHLGATHNSTLLPSLAGTFTYQLGDVATTYRFGGDDFRGIALDAAAGIVNMQFMLDGKLQTQQDEKTVDFAVQDSVVLSSTSCFYGNNATARIDVAVRLSAKTAAASVKSLYIEIEDRSSVTKSDFFAVDSSAKVNEAYTMWSVNIPGSPFNRNVGAEIDGVEVVVAKVMRTLPALPSCDSDES